MLDPDGLSQIGNSMKPPDNVGVLPDNSFVDGNGVALQPPAQLVRVEGTDNIFAGLGENGMVGGFWKKLEIDGK